MRSVFLPVLPQYVGVVQNLIYVPEMYVILVLHLELSWRVHRG